MVFDEARLIAERLDRITGGQAILTQMAVSSVPNMGVKPESTKSMADRFRALVSKMIGGDR